MTELLPIPGNPRVASPARRPWSRVALVAALAATVPLFIGAEHLVRGPDSTLAWCAAAAVPADTLESVSAPDARRCGLEGKTITYDGIAAVVPEAGTAVAASAVTTDGELELVVDHAADGSVRVHGHHVTAQPALLVPAATTSSTCGDGTYKHLGYRAGKTYQWYYNPKNRPNSVTGTAESAIVAATSSVFAGRNRCGQPADLKVSQKYLGKNWRHAQVDSAGTCTGNDGWNVASWARLDKALGIACTYYSGGTGTRYVLASDMVLNYSASWFTTKPSGCRQGTDLQSVVVHERGHTLGLGHVDPRYHPGQVMTTTIPSCTYKRLLGLGDYRGLVRLYGHR
ncbi:MAG TPA: matrixin family metalloprotease [Micromonosporaceae bacterium]|jgi:hypothetical protein|nr:matrixin family metalloprotease [Micromonosporaceae bacterium]